MQLNKLVERRAILLTLETMRISTARFPNYLVATSSPLLLRMLWLRCKLLVATRMLHLLFSRSRNATLFRRVTFIGELTH